MALIKCPECGQMISEYADKCISCGCPMDKIKEIIASQAKEVENEIKKEKASLLEEKLTDEERKFINAFNAFLDKKFPGMFSFANTDYYRGIKLNNGTTKYPFVFKKPKNVLLFRYPSKLPDTYLIREIKTFDGKTASDLLGLIGTCVELPKRDELAELVAARKKEEEKFIGSDDDDEEVGSGLKFLDRVSSEETEFILNFRRILRRAYRTVFSYRNNSSRYGIKHKETSVYMFWFKLKGPDLIFVFKDKDGKRNEAIVSDLTNNSLNALLSIVNKTMNPDSNDQEVDASEYMKNNTDNMLDRLSNEQRQFVESFQKLIVTRYSKDLSLSLTKSYLSFRFIPEEKSIFWFKIKDDSFLFRSRDKGKNKIEDIVIGLQPTKEDLIKIRNIAKKALDSYGISPVYEVNPEESVLMNKDKDKDSVGSAESNSFLDLLTNEEKSFVVSFLKKIEQKYSKIFTCSITNFCASLIIDEKGNYRCAIAKRDQKLAYFYKAGKNDDVKSFDINDFNGETMENILKKTDSIVASAKGELVSNEKIVDVQKTIKKPNKTTIYEYIRLEMIGHNYNASPSLKALCKNVKKYLFDVFNHNVKTNKFYDIVFASSVATFYGHHLAWNKNEGIRSARTVYGYFKAQTIIGKIRDYEEMFKKENQIVTDYMALLEYLFKEIDAGKEVDYQHAPGLSADFALVPEEVLSEILDNFKAYEND